MESVHLPVAETPGSQMNGSIVSKQQLYLFKVVQEVFADVEVKLNYKHPDLRRNLNSQVNIELDIFIPCLNLAFEYHGEQHWNWHFAYGSPQPQQRRDERRRQVCKQHGITLIEIPYFWDHKKTTLVDIIRKQVPGIFEHPNLQRYSLARQLNGNTAVNL
jgi:hypothetical protein